MVIERRNGFTLIELLVVVAIIALLIAILSTALNGARYTAQKVACSSNMKQMAFAFLEYAEDHDQAIPGAGHQERERVGNKWVGVDWVVNLNPRFSLTELEPEEPEALRRGAIFPYIGITEVYKSPVDPRDYIRSYSMNYKVDTRHDEPPTYIWGPGFSRSMIRIKQPTRTLGLVTEGDPRGHCWDSFVIHVDGDAWLDWPGYWQLDSINLMYFDGHVASYRYQDSRTKEATFYSVQPDNADLKFFQSILAPQVDEPERD